MIRWSAGALAASVLVLCAGCTPQDHVMTTLTTEGTIVFVPCDEIVGVQHISASLRGIDGDIWHARGEDGAFGPENPVFYGVTPEGFSTDVGPEDFEPTSEIIHFSLVNTAVDARTWLVDGAQLVEGKWLDNNGRLHDQPCR